MLALHNHILMGNWQYYWFWFLNIKDLVVFNWDFKFSINLDIKNTVEYLIKNCKSLLDIVTWNNKNGAQIWSSWYEAQISSEWQNAVIAWIWYNNKIKAKIWSWITLAEYDDNRICICVKSQKIDWKTLKEDTFYILKNGEFIIYDEN